MSINQMIIEQLNALISGSITGKEKKTLLDQIQNDAELADMYKILLNLSVVSSRNKKSLQQATQKLSKKVYTDFLKEQASAEIQYGVQIYDSSLIPLPSGVRPALVDTRSLKYQVGNFVVELTVYPITLDSVEIIGQVSTMKKNSTINVSVESKGKRQKGVVDQFGLFRFDRVALGVCTLTFTTENFKEGVIELSL